LIIPKPKDYYQIQKDYNVIELNCPAIFILSQKYRLTNVYIPLFCTYINIIYYCQLKSIIIIIINPIIYVIAQHSKYHKLHLFLNIQG